MSDPLPPGQGDPVLDRRRRIAGLVQLGQRVGYGLFGVAIVLFAVGLVAGFGGAVTPGIVACIVGGSIVLAPAIVFGYAVKAAEREDREQGRATLGRPGSPGPTSPARPPGGAGSAGSGAGGP